MAERSPTDVFMSLLGKRLARAVLTEAERAGLVRSAAELVGGAKPLVFLRAPGGVAVYA